MTYDENTNLWLAGKTIRKADVRGRSVMLEFEDSTKFAYWVSGGGCSIWELLTANGGPIHFEEGGAR